jgi:branched-chain amino acid transport system substrate-binding protein
VSPGLDEFAYAAESYDATILVALAAQAAGDDAGESLAAKMQEVSSGGEKCTSFADCKQLLEDGQDIDYDGVSGTIEFNDAGDPSEASVGIYEYGADNRYTFLQAQEGTI